MTSTTKYTIVSATDSTTLAEKVMENIALGWTLQGGVGMNFYSGWIFAQAMTLDTAPTSP